MAGTCHQLVKVQRHRWAWRHPSRPPLVSAGPHSYLQAPPATPLHACPTLMQCRNVAEPCCLSFHTQTALVLEGKVAAGLPFVLWAFLALYGTVHPTFTLNVVSDAWRAWREFEHGLRKWLAITTVTTVTIVTSWPILLSPPAHTLKSSLPELRHPSLPSLFTGFIPLPKGPPSK